MRAEEVVVAVGLSLILVAMAVSVAGLLKSLDLHVTRKCPMSKCGECRAVEIESGGRWWRAECSGHTIRCRRRRRELRALSGGIRPDGRI